MKMHSMCVLCAGIMLNLAISPVHASLLGRDLDGIQSTIEAFYDDQLNVTWLMDANYAKTSGYDADGKMTWSDANAWAAGLNPYGSGISGWRLPTVTDAFNDGCTYGTDCGGNFDPSSGEMAHLYYVTLGNVANSPTPPNAGNFINLAPDYYYYWAGTENGATAWHFYFSYGFQDLSDKTTGYYAWAVHEGDVGIAAVPVPATVWLFGSGLIGLVGVARKSQWTSRK